MSTPQADRVRHVGEREARRTAEEARQAGWRQPELRQGAVPRRLPARPDPPAAAPRGSQPARRGVLRQAAGVLRGAVDGALIERDAQIPDEVVKGLAARRVRHEDRAGVRRARAVQALLQPGADRWSGRPPRRSARCCPRTSRSACRSRSQLFGTEEQKQRCLPRCARGEISAFLLTEPDVGSDPARLGTTATPRPTATATCSTASKLWATNGAVADLLVVMARVPKSEGHRGGITAFVVEGDAPGITVEHRNAFMGLRGIENCVTRFHDVFVPAENLIGERGPGPEDRADHAEHRPAVAAGDAASAPASGR